MTLNNKMETSVTFRPLAFSDMPLMHQWFNLPHVREFYSLREWSEEEVREKLKPYLHGELPVLGFIVLINEQPIGYLQQYKISDYPWPNQNLAAEVIDNAAGMDIFIGDKRFIGRGVGSEVVKAFIESKIWPEFRYCIVDPDIKNIAAINCYKKLNFLEHRLIETKDALGQATTLKLMILER